MSTQSLTKLTNSQPIEKTIIRDDGLLEVNYIFRTIQGEGPLTGTPAIFVRLAGCNLQCPGCDTEYTKRILMSVNDIMDSIRLAVASKTRPGISTVVITGGEPFRQPNVGNLVSELQNGGFYAQIETNGTYSPASILNDMYPIIVCSPKTPIIHDDMRWWADSWKYVIEADSVDPDDGLPTSVLGKNIRPARPWGDHYRPDDVKDHEIWISPMDTGDSFQNKLNTEAAVESCMKFGYRLSLQVHKIIGRP